MGEAKRRRAAGELPEGVKRGPDGEMVVPLGASAEAVVFAREGTRGGWQLPAGPADVFLVEVGQPPELGPELGRECAEWLARAAPQKPGSVIHVTVGGFDSDPREVWDIPVAREALAAFRQRMAELDRTGRIRSRMDRITRAMLDVCAGVLPRSAINVQRDWSWSGPEIAEQLAEDRELAREAQARADATDQAAASGSPRN